MGTLIRDPQEGLEPEDMVVLGRNQAKNADLCEKHIAATRSYINGERKPTVCKGKDIRKATLGTPTFMGWIEDKSMDRRENRGQKQDMVSKKKKKKKAKGVKSSRRNDLPLVSSDDAETSG